MGRVDVETPRVVAQVRHVRTLSLATLEALALEVEALGRVKGKVTPVTAPCQGS